MADRYWVGGAGTWNSSSTTNWSTTSGGSGGASVPTSSDNVFFDSGSDNGAPFTVTMSGTVSCNNWTISTLDYATTFSGSTTFSVYGSLSFPTTNLTVSAIRPTFAATTTGKTIQTNGIQMPGTFEGHGGAWTFLSDWNGALRINDGTLNTNGYTVTGSMNNNVFSAGGEVVVLNLGSSTLNVTQWTLTPSSAMEPAYDLTVNAGTSTINIGSVTGAAFYGGNQTYNNVNFTDGTSWPNAVQIAHDNTFNNLTFASVTSTGSVTYGGPNGAVSTQTVTGTLTLGSANQINRRLKFQNLEFVVANVATLADTDFQNVTVTGASAPWSGTRLGNCTGNSGIIFDPGKTVYWVYPISQSFFQPFAWATTPGGTADGTSMPLAQDTAVITDAYPPAGTTITAGSFLPLPNIDFSSRTSNAVTFTNSLSTFIYGSFTLSSAVTLGGSASLTFSGNAPSTITTAGKTLPYSTITISNLGGVQLLDNCTTNNSSILLVNGSLDLNDLVLNCFSFRESDESTRPDSSLDFGTTGSIDLTGYGALTWNVSTPNIYGTPTVNLIYGGGSGSQTATITGAQVTTFPNTAVNFNVNTTNISSILTAGVLGSLDFGIFTGQWVLSSTYLTGNLTMNASQTTFVTSTSLEFIGNTSVQYIDTANVTIGFPILLGGPYNPTNGNYVLSGNVNLDTGKTFSLQSGNLDASGYSWTGLGNIAFTGGYTAGLANLNAPSITLSQSDTKVFLNGNIDVASYTFYSGNLNVQSANLNIGNFTCNTYVQTGNIDLGTANITVSGTGNVWNMQNTSNLISFSGNTSTIILSDNTTTSRTFIGGNSLNYGNLVIGGSSSTSTTTLSGNAIFNGTVSSTKTVAHTVAFTAGTTTKVSDWTITGNSGAVVTLQSTSASQFTLQKIAQAAPANNAISLDYLNVSNSRGLGPNTWYAGNNSTDGGNNSFWYFNDAPLYPPINGFFMIYGRAYN